VDVHEKAPLQKVDCRIMELFSLSCQLPLPGMRMSYQVPKGGPNPRVAAG
jgi:hypothetical protein